MDLLHRRTTAHHKDILHSSIRRPNSTAVILLKHLPPHNHIITAMDNLRLRRNNMAVISNLLHLNNMDILPQITGPLLKGSILGQVQLLISSTKPVS